MWSACSGAPPKTSQNQKDKAPQGLVIDLSEAD
jgi:hypothetical protein